jgi:hypothetical protein
MAGCLRSVSGTSSDHLFRFRRQSLGARREHTLFRLAPMPYKHGLEIGITTRLFRRGRRGSQLDGGSTAETADATGLVQPVGLGFGKRGRGSIPYAWHSPHRRALRGAR